MATNNICVLLSVRGLLAAAGALCWTAAFSGEEAQPVDGGVLEEILVTAQKQELTLQKAPVAITAIGDEALIAAGVSDIRAAADFVPSVRFQMQNAATEIYIRGVGSTLDFPNVDPPNAFHFNGIYVPREGTSVPLYDIAQLEVLPGPQGTLYGRSSLGGIVNVTFKRPTHDWETRLLLEGGDYSMLHASVAQNIPVTDRFAIRGAVDYAKHDGYMASGADSQDDAAGRLSLQYEPTEALTLYAFGSFVDKTGSPANLVAKGVDASGRFRRDAFIQSDPWNDLLPGNVLATSPFGQVNARDTDYDNRMFGGQLDWSISDALTLTYVPSYLKFFVGVDYWLSGLPAWKDDEFEQTTHELRLTGTHDWGSWLVGLYAYDMKSNGDFYVASFDRSGFPVSLVDQNRIKGSAAFGQVTYDLTDQLRVIAGGRFSEDERDGRGRFFNGSGLAPFTSDQSFDDFDYKFGFNYDLAPAVMLYASIETGYQPGTYNTFASTPTVSNKVDAADLTAYTAGFKSRFLSGRLQINEEVFYYDYENLFASAYNTVLQTTQTFNAQKVEIYGSQLDVIFKPASSNQLSLSVGYVHARNKEFTLPDRTRSFNDYQLQYSPDWTVALAGYQDFSFGSGGYLRLEASSRYEGSFYADFSHTPGGYQQAYVKTNASLTYRSMDESWSVGVWVKNIENEAVLAATAGGSNFPFNANGATSYLQPPRTAGIRFTKNF